MELTRVKLGVGNEMFGEYVVPFSKNLFVSYTFDSWAKGFFKVSV